MSSVMRILILCLCALSSGWVWSQCTTDQRSTYLVSDRYRDVANLDNRLILANGHGLLFRELDNPTSEPLHIEPLPGDIVQVLTAGQLIFATAQDVGFYVLSPVDTSEAPQILSYTSVTGLQEAYVFGDAVFLRQRDMISQYRLNPNGSLSLVDELSLVATHLVADENLVYLRKQDGSVSVIPYDEGGLGDLGGNVRVNGIDAFYNIAYHKGALVLDGSTGVSWAAFNAQGQIASSGSYFKNEGSDLVWGMGVAEHYLYLRFSDRLDVHLVSDTHGLTKVGSLPQTFSDIGNTKLAPRGNFLHLINAAQGSRDWSLSSYQLGDASLLTIGELDAGTEELSGGANVAGNIFLASSQQLYRADDLTSTDGLDNLQLVKTFSGTITELIASDNYLAVSSVVANAGSTQVQVFSVADDGTLDEEYNNSFQGTLSNFTHHDDTIGFTQFFRTTEQDRYEAHRLSMVNNGFRLDTLSHDVPVDANSPFDDFQVSELGRTWRNGNVISVHGDDGLLLESAYDREGDVITVIAKRGVLWVEAQTGLMVLLPSGDRFDEVGHYPHWVDVTLLSGNIILARNQESRRPGYFHALGLSDGLVTGDLNVSATSEPFLIAALDEEFLVAEQSAVNLFDYQCPSQDYLYLVPVGNGLELELSTLVKDTDVITMTIFNELNQVIGYQTLDSDLIDSNNGKEGLSWLFDYNHLYTPTSFLLQSSVPLAPVVSSFAGSGTARFAYQVSEQSASELFVPHVPSDLSNWDADVIVRNFDYLASPDIQVSNPAGEQFSQAFHQSTEVLNLEETTFVGNTPWARVFSSNINSRLSGFSMFRDNNKLQAAAVPLIEQFTDFMVAPYIAGRTNPDGWTGLVMANASVRREVNVRVLGYNSQGNKVVDRSLIINPSSSLVLVLENWLREIRADEDTVWLALAAENPIMGMILYGNVNNPQLAGLPLSGRTGNMLTFSGLRVDKEWWTSLQVTNIDPDAGSLVVNAYDGFGVLLDTRSFDIHDQQQLEFNMDNLYGDLPESSRKAIKTVRMESDRFLCGFIFRGLRDKPTLEAVSALAEEY